MADGEFDGGLISRTVAVLIAAGECELSTRQLAILACVAMQPGLSVKDVAGCLRIHKPNVSYILDKLISMGLLCSTKDPKDRRRVHLTLTESGNALLRRISMVDRAAE